MRIEREKFRWLVVSLMLVGLYAGAARAESIPPVDAQKELGTILGEIQKALLGKVFGSKTIGTGACRPEMSFGFTELKLAFTRTDTCNLQGSLALGYFPLQARVDLEVFDMKYIQSMRFNADLQFSSTSQGVTVGWQFLNGRVALASAQMVFNGRLAATFSGKNLSLDTRANAFDSASAAGFALITTLKVAPPAAVVQKFQACALSGGVATQIDAGALSGCFNLGTP